MATIHSPPFTSTLLPNSSPKPKTSLLSVPLPQSHSRRKGGSGRPRSASLVSFQEIEENYDGQLDQSSMSNLNANWLNYKGAWSIHVLLLILAQLLFSSIPVVTPPQSWTLLNLGYQILTYFIFHYGTGMPLESQNSNSGAYDRLTLWEQIDDGAQYTPTRKWLTILPILVFLLATHYITPDPRGILFSVNFIALCVFGILPKLPTFHRIRLRFGMKDGDKSGGDVTPFDHSGPPTPVETQMRGLRPWEEQSEPNSD